MSLPSPESFPLLTSMHQADVAGLTRHQVRQRVRSGEWDLLRRGMYLTDNPFEDPELDEFARARMRHAFRAIAAARSHPGTAVAYESAAALAALPTWSSLEGDVHLVVPTGKGTGIRAGIRVRWLDLPADHVLADGITRTTPARTWLDITRRG